MKRNYKIQGLDCANCACGLERAISKISGVKSVVISFMTLKMTVEVQEENAEEIFEKVIKCAINFEDGISVRRC